MYKRQFPTVAALESRGAVVRVHDPLYTDDELAAYGWTAHHVGDAADAVVVQTDHADYAALGAADFPGVRVLVDGRRITDANGWAGVTRRVLGTA